nr:histidine phosphatase family protein [uncultured Prevotella sp.]
MATTLYLVRHGETVDNAAHIMQGQTPGELNAAGVAQAEELAARMANEPIDVFVSSDLKRSVQTCEIIARKHHAEVVTTSLLRERDWGSFTGRFIPTLPQDPKDWPDDIESIESMKSRAQNFITWLRVTYPDKNILAVGHGIINKALQSVYFRQPMNKIGKMGNAEVRILML